MKNSIRITGGYLKGKKIPFDFKSSLRPTSSKLREVLFNWLQFEIQEYQCLDLFSGTGALGIEAISRGAKRTVFIESNKKNFLALKRSISDLNLKNNSMILFKDGLSWIKDNNLSVLTSSIFNLKDFDKSVIDKNLSDAEKSLENPDLDDQKKFLIEQKIESLRSISTS